MSKHELSLDMESKVSRVYITPPLQNCYPVVVGSFALKVHGIEGITPRDIDLICHLQTAQQIAWYASKIVGQHVYLYESVATTPSPSKRGKIEATSRSLPGGFCEPSSSGKLILDVSVFTDSSTSRLLFDLCNGNVAAVDKGWSMINIDLNESVQIQAHLPCLEWLFALYRGHLHRIPRISSSQVENIKAWEHYMTRYHAIRDHVGYRKLDAQVSEPGPMRNLFLSEFERVTAALGDAPSLDKPPESFFNDNVKRYIDHDELHKRVAVLNRGAGAEPLYPRFQSDPESVTMDESLFKAATVTPQDRLETIREELMVLYLERKVLPAVVECQDRIETFRGFNEIVCHFMTNLCGSGHSWLRQYCLDHWHMVNDFTKYPRHNLRAFANTFRKEGMLLEPVQDRIETLEAFLQYHRSVESLVENRNSYIHETLVDAVGRDVMRNLKPHTVLDDKLQIDGFSVILEGEHGSGELTCEEEVYTLDFVEQGFTNPIVSQVFEDYFTIAGEPSNGDEKWPVFVIEWASGHDGWIIYNSMRGFGVFIGSLDDYFFIIESKSSGRSDVTFGVHQFSITAAEGSTVDPTLEKWLSEAVATNATYDATSAEYFSDTRTSSYYKSTCDGGYDREVELEYVNQYGTCFPELSAFVEMLARISLDAYVDEEINRYSGY